MGVIIVIIIMAVLGAILYKLSNKYSYNTVLEASSFICIFATVCTTLIVVLFGVINYYSSYTDYLTLTETKESLIYKSEAFNNGFSDELGLNNNNLLNEIKTYNEGVISLKRNANSIWLGIYYNPIVNELEVIDYSVYNFNEEKDVEQVEGEIPEMCLTK